MGDCWYQLNLSELSDRLVDYKRCYPSLRFFRLAEVVHQPETPYRLYELVREGVLQTLGHTGGFEDIDVFMERIYVPSYSRCAETQYLASDGEDWIALSSVQVKGEEGICGLTTVRPSHRKRGIAMMLKTWVILDCRNRGVTRLVTRVNEKNAPMQTLNEKLGFRRIDGNQQM